MRWRQWTLLVAFVAVLSLLILTVPGAGDAAPDHFYPQTGFGIDDPRFVDYFDHRGGLRAFGYPVSREFQLEGLPVQIFQRAVMQRHANGRVTLLNLLDGTFFPYTRVNGAQFPPLDPTLVQSAPPPGSAGYASAVLGYVAQTAPDSWNGLPIRFYQAFRSTISYGDAFPNGGGSASLLPGLELELWGVPTSRPAFDPANHNFVYQRFQRGILHYDRTTGVSQGILLADYFKSILMNENVPADLLAQARSSPFLGQYNPLMPHWVSRPDLLPNSDLTRAFEPERPIVVLDPGHGGQEIGTSFTFADGLQLREKDLNLAVATRTTALLRRDGITVVQTRTADSWVDADLRILTGGTQVGLADDLQARVDIANNAHASLFLSTHFNGYTDPTLRGTTVYYDDARQFARRNAYFAGLLDTEAVAALRGLGYAGFDRGVQPDSQAVGQGSHFYVLGPDATRPITMPGALVEGLFLTNPAEAEVLRDDPRVIDALAHAYARAIERYFGL